MRSGNLNEDRTPAELRDALRESEARRELALEAANMGTFIWHVEEDRGELDARFRALFGQPPDGELNLAEAMTLIHPDDGAGYAAAVVEATRPDGLRELRHDMRVKQPGGGWRWIAVTGKVSFDATGRPLQMAGTVIDATVRKTAEAALRESEAKYRTMFEEMREGFLVLERVAGDPVDYRFLAANPAYERHTGLSNPVGRTMREIAPTAEESFECYRIVEETGLPQTMITQVPEVDRWFEVKASPVERPGQIAVLFIDITERKRTEAALHQSEAQLRAFLNTSPALIWYNDPEGRNLFANRCFLEFVGSDVPIGGSEKWQLFVHPDQQDAYASGYFDAVRNRCKWSHRGRVRRYDGEWRWLNNSAEPLFGAAGEYLGHVGVSVDVTTEVKAEEALRISEERQAFLLKLSDALRSLVDPMEIQGAASRLLGQQLGLDRCGYAEIDFAGEVTTVHQDYHVPDVAAFVGSYRLDDFGADFIDTLRRGETLVIEDVTKDQAHANPLVAASHADSETVAMIAAPLVKGTRFVAVLFAHSRTARHWTSAEVALIEEVAERTWAAVEWARAEAALRESEERFRQFSDASPNVLWIRDADTLEMQFASPAFEKIYGIPGPDSGDGRLRNWVRLIEPEHRKSVLGNFRRVRAGERVEHEFQIRRATDGALRWIHNTDFPLRDASGAVRWLAGIGADITDLKQANDRQGVLVDELQHRTRNLIAVVQSLSNQTLRGAASLEDFGNRFRLRLSALARVQELLSFREPGEKVTFKELLCAELDALGVSNGLASKLTLDGPADVPLRSTTVQTFALALHELATNASKYGAFAFPNGHLAVSWRVEPASGDDPPRLNVEWRESGVVMPEINAPARGGGYGRQLIERALPYQLNAKTTFEMGPDGVHCTIAVPLGGGGDKRRSVKP